MKQAALCPPTAGQGQREERMERRESEICKAGQIIPVGENMQFYLNARAYVSVCIVSPTPL